MYRFENSKHRYIFLTCAIFWLLFSIWLALNRSLWWDEVFRLGQSQMSLIEGIKSLWNEPSPFAPGEILLNYFSRVLLLFLPLELWTRIPGIIFGLLTLKLTFIIYELNNHAKYLPFFVLMSVALAMLSIQMRPYGSLIFCGAMSTAILIDDKERISNFFILFSLLFGHIYGICYICFALIMKRKYFFCLLGIIIVGITLVMTNINPIKDVIEYPSWFSAISTILFVVGNPNKASYFYLFFFILSIYFNIRSKKYFNIILLLFISTLGPLFVIISSGYLFAARQFAGGVVPFLFLSSVGLNQFIIRLNLKNKSLHLIFLFFVLSGTSLYPWINVFVLGHQRPLIDQPIHLFKKISKYIVQNKDKQIFLTNPCQIDSIIFYLNLFRPFKAKRVFTTNVDGFVMDSIYLDDTRIDTPHSPLFCKSNFGDQNNRVVLNELVHFFKSKSSNYSLVLYDQIEFEDIGIKKMRTW